MRTARIKYGSRESVGELDRAPAWSPDGTRIAFSSERDGNSDIYVMNPDGSNKVRLTEHAAIDTDPAWSPAGTRIAFTSNRESFPAIWVMNADGTGATRLTSNNLRRLTTELVPGRKANRVCGANQFE